MADINFDCTKCGQNLDAPEDMAGLFIECPSCSTIIKIPLPSERNAASQKESTFREPPPQPPRGDEGGDEEKGSTIRITLPPDLGMPTPPHRKVIIKRTSK